MELLSSKIPGLDEILNGGYVLGRMYLVRGEPGVGKSLLGAHFLQAGLDNGETVLYIHGEESKDAIIENTSAIGLNIANAEFLDLGPEADFFTEGSSYKVINPTDLESEQVTNDIQQAIEEINPSRVFLDPITQLEYVESDDYQYRKRLLSLLRFLRKHDMTVLASKTWDEGKQSKLGSSNNAESISDGLIDMFRDEGERRIKSPKHRGRGQSDRTHALEIRSNGVEVYPQIIPDNDEYQLDSTLISAGQDGLDKLFGGGIERGTVTFLSGPTGVGKSTLSSKLLSSAAHQGLTVGGYLFEEPVEQFEFRAESFGYPLSDLRESESLFLSHIEPLSLSAEEFAQQVTTTATEQNLDMVVIDGLDGYQLSLQGDKQRLIKRLHALTRVLKQVGVTIIIVDEISKVSGITSATSTNTSYIADNIIYLTYTKEGSGLSRAMGVLKKRIGEFDTDFHYFTLESDIGITLGETVGSIDELLE